MLHFLMSIFWAGVAIYLGYTHDLHGMLLCFLLSHVEGRYAKESLTDA